MTPAETLEQVREAWGLLAWSYRSRISGSDPKQTWSELIAPHEATRESWLEEGDWLREHAPAILDAVTPERTEQEREALEHRYNVTRTDGRSAPGEKHHGCRYFVLDLTHDPKAQALLDAYFDHPTPHVVTTVEELEALPNGTIVKSSAGTVACRHSEFFGVVFGDERPFPWDLLALPATVLTPAPAPRDREEMVEVVARAMCDASPEHDGWEFAYNSEKRAWRILARAAIAVYENRGES